MQRSRPTRPVHSYKMVAIVPLLFAGAALAAGPRPNQIKNLVTFGDSYTDIVSTEQHSATIRTRELTVRNQDAHADGGVMWPIFAAQDGNLTLFPFAKSGATCSNNVTTNGAPSVFEAQLPAYFAANLTLRPSETVYTLWIGTNDVGVHGLLTDHLSTPNVSLVDVVACAVNWVEVLYKSGARNFIFQNVSYFTGRVLPGWILAPHELTRPGLGRKSIDGAP